MVKINQNVNEKIKKEYILQYDNWNKKDRNGFLILGITSYILRTIGLEKRKIIIDKSKLIKIKRVHKGMTDNIIKMLPDILKNPILIIKSQSVDRRIVIFGEIMDNFNNPVLVALELNPIENKKTNDKFYKVVSAYGKDNKSSIQNWLNNPYNILYIDIEKNRTIKWLNGLGLQLPVPFNNSSTEVNISNK